MLVQQLDVHIRYPNLNLTTIQQHPEILYQMQKRCINNEMDQGFHNYIIYSGILDRYLDTKIFPQGEGPVNTLGGFIGSRVLINKSLVEWGVVRGTSGNYTVHNWNGDLSPIVHQYNRFM